ncbi:flagellar assembly protein FliW [Paenibacillus sepulcri]|uniref:Flagellar assembly factor FliW n=1 Tax=Paenibacillus sepulcri TaxID=359917 RepID=A0ABS7C048_9BACL|nr:flagellar assembly protein FliW [Paenibacillus sepulcri]
MKIMQLRTERFGEINISKEDIYIFTKGIPGFEEHTGFVIIAPEDDQPFAFLQSVNDEKLNFLIADPFLFYPEYEFEIPSSALAELGVDSVEQVMVRSIINIDNSLESATINLVAPVVFNTSRRVAKQVVLGRTSYMTRHPLFATAEK